MKREPSGKEVDDKGVANDNGGVTGRFGNHKFEAQFANSFSLFSVPIVPHEAVPEASKR